MRVEQVRDPALCGFGGRIHGLRRNGDRLAGHARINARRHDCVGRFQKIPNHFRTDF
jgi:hypothetical protein